MLVSADPVLAARARKLASQARDPAPHYEHSEIGYNYRLSGVLAAIGRGQLQRLEERVESRRRNFQFYYEALKDTPGVGFMPEAPWGRHSRWLTVLTVSPRELGTDRDDLLHALELDNVEARPAWKPMHQQPVFRHCEVVGGFVADRLFAEGLCLPSGSNLSVTDLERVIDTIQVAVSGTRSARLPPRASRPLSSAVMAKDSPFGWRVHVQGRPAMRCDDVRGDPHSTQCACHSRYSRGTTGAVLRRAQPTRHSLRHLAFL